MDGTVIALVSQIEIMFLLMAVGFVLSRVGMVGERGVAEISDIVIYVAFPATILRSLMVDLSPARLEGAGFCVVASVVILVASVVVANVLGRGDDVVARYGIVFSNSGFLGIPLVAGVLGQEYVFYLSVCNAVCNVFIWTYGIWLITGDREQIELGRVLANPSVVALAAGAACFVLSVRPPQVVSLLLDDVGGMSTGLVMIVLGACLAKVGLRHTFGDRRLYATCCVRLLVIPALALGLLWAASSLVEVNVLLTVLIVFATPCASLTAVFAQKFGRDAGLGTGLVSLSTLMSLVTLPAFVALGMMVL